MMKKPKNTDGCTFVRLLCSLKLDWLENAVNAQATKAFAFAVVAKSPKTAINHGVDRIPCRATKLGGTSFPDVSLFGCLVCCLLLVP